MPRYKLIIEYDGRDFVGWQRQDNGTAIQELVEDAIAQFSGESATTIAAGRTDAGVHALGQVIHFDLARQWTPGTVRDALNFHLKPAPVAVVGAEIASADFNARFSARARAYLYRITNRRPPPTLERGRTHLLALRNDTAFPHPMHLHGFAFRVLARNGRPSPRHEWLDTVLVDPKESVEVAFVADNPGDWLFHCHILEHMKAGMYATLRVA